MAKRKPVPVKIWKKNEHHLFESISDCARFLKITQGEVSQARHTCRGWNIEFLGERKKLSELKCPVYMFNLHGEFLQRFDSVHECARFLNTPAKVIIQYLKNHKGYGSGIGKYKQYLLRYQKENEDTYDPADYA